MWVTAWLPGGPGELARYWAGRAINGKLEPTGEVSYGLRLGQAVALRQILNAASLDSRRRDGVIQVAPVVTLTIESRGREGDWLRDPIITEVHVDPSGPEHADLRARLTG